MVPPPRPAAYAPPGPSERSRRWRAWLVVGCLAAAAFPAVAQDPAAPLAEGAGPPVAAETLPGIPPALPAPGEPLPAAGPPPPMYLVDPQQPGGFSGIPVGTAADLVPSWPRWFAGASGLVMTRTLPGGVPSMQPVGGTQLTTSDASATWPGGVDLHVGRWFGMRQQHAVECIYWGVYGIGSAAQTAAPPPGIDAIPQAPGILVGSTPAAAWLDAAAAQRIARADLVNDVEINWLYAPGERPEFLSTDPSAPSRRLNLMWLAGFRFFELQDVLTLTSVPSGAAPGALDLGVATNNNLYGGQVGAKFDWRFLPRLRLNAVPKFLIAGNAITNTTSFTSSAGLPVAFASGAPGSVHSTLGVFSWLGSVDTSVAWDVTDRWSLWIGYRVVGVGNVAQADGQWPSVVADPSSISGVSAGSSTIIHGGFAGFQGRY